MLKLDKSGLPIYLQNNSILALSAELKIDEYSRKYGRNMKGLLLDDNYIDEDAVIYDVYRNIRFPRDQKLLSADQFKYDITIVMPGLLGNERKKTSGHYHGYNSERTATYAEVYEVLQGTAYYILQKSNNFDQEANDLSVEDLIIVKVEAGQTLIVPPDYGHVSINGGADEMIFSNLAYIPCKVHYEPVRHYQGMAYYIIEDNGEISFTPNPNYQNLPEVKFATVNEAPQFGIIFGKPVYQSYCENPEKFDFLKNPEPYKEQILSLLSIEE